MATKVVMAQLSPTMEEGKLLEWKLQEGDAVEAGDILAEIETDKANMDIESLGSGVLRKIVVQAGATVPVGVLIGVVAEPDEDISSILAAAETQAAPAPASEPTPEPAAQPASPEVVPAPVAPVAQVAAPAAPLPESAPAGRVKASPLARRLAEAAELRIEDIAGSGPGGRIVKRDVEAAAAAPPVSAQPPASAARFAPAGPGRLVAETVEVSLMRKAIARTLAASIGPVPHFFLTTEIDMEQALDLRARLNERLSAGKIGVNDLLIKTVAEALARHPDINASWHGDTIVRHGSADVGVAVALEGGGLITPIVRAADQKGLLQISEEARELIGRARDKRLLPEEYQGATFSISNLGMFEITEFTAIINPPEAGILAIGKTEAKPVVVDGDIVVRRRMQVTMSCDHRVIDGAMGAAFLGTFKAMLENPLEMML
ncbi:MAG: dihydrolipoamide acetyltransferase family protein [Gemmatimonadota bacterium]